MTQNSNFIGGQPAIITGLFNCGHLENVGEDGSTEVVVIALEQSGKTSYLRDVLPVGIGSTWHRLAEAVTGFTMRPADVKLDDLLGAVVLAEIVPSETCCALRTVKTFPRPPRYASLHVQHVTRSVELGGSEDRPAVAGGDVPRRDPDYPLPPEPRTKPVQWSVADLKRAQLPAGLPPIVTELVQRSQEWRKLK